MGRPIQTYYKDWTISEATGIKTIYVKFRTDTGLVSSRSEVKLLHDPISLCTRGVVDGIDGKDDRFGGPGEPRIDSMEDIYPEDFIKGDFFDAIYYIGESLLRHPLMNPLSVFTYSELEPVIHHVTDEILPAFGIGLPLPPSPGSVILKFIGASDYYVITENTADIYRPILHTIPEDRLVESVGTGWENYVMEVDLIYYPRFAIGKKIEEEDSVDVSRLFLMEELEGLLEIFGEFK